MNWRDEEESPGEVEEIYSKATGTRLTRAMNYYEHVKRLNSETSSPVSEGENRYTPVQERCMKEKQLEGRSEFCLKDISNSKEVARAHRRVSSKLLAFEESGLENVAPGVLLKPLMLVVPCMSSDTRPALVSKDPSLALISEFPSSASSDCERPVDVRSQTEGKGSTILSELSSDSSPEEIAYVSANNAPVEPLEIDLYEAGEKDDEEPQVFLQKVTCPACRQAAAPIVTYTVEEEAWYTRLLELPRFLQCCREWRPQQSAAQLQCRKCGQELLLNSTTVLEGFT